MSLNAMTPYKHHIKARDRITPGQIIGFIIMVIISVYKHNRFSDETSADDSGLANDDIDRALAYIDIHFCENINLDQIAKLIHISPSYVSSYFKKHTGMNFKDYLTKVRIAEAANILLHENLKTYELAERVGFSDARYFSELFKKIYGKTPMELKRQDQ